jgi:hypothetical protein
MDGHLSKPAEFFAGLADLSGAFFAEALMAF